MRFLFLSSTFFITHLFSTQNLIAQNKKFDAGIFFNINANTISRKDRSPMRSPAGTKNINEDFNDFDISWIGIFKWSMNPKAAKNVFLGFRFEHSILSIHELWNLYNINWGVQFEYVL